MAPRNNDANASYKKKNFPAENNDVDVKDIVPCLLHKKHKVVKLVKSQLQKIQEEGLLCGTAGSDVEINILDEENKTEPTRRRLRDLSKAGTSQERRQSSLTREEMDLNSTSEGRGSMCTCMYLLAILMAVFLILYLMVWISAGPLSRTIAHTPIPINSFVRTDNLCTLERKYLLRWSKPEYFE